jgi:DNA-binding protein HU-beta
MATKPAAKTAAKKPAAAKPAAAAKKAPAQVTIPLSKLIAELAETHGLSKKAAAAFFDDFVQLTVKNLKKGNKVRITGLGILAVRKRAARMGRNPATGEAIKIKASKKVAFRVAKDLKEAI